MRDAPDLRSCFRVLLILQAAVCCRVCADGQAQNHSGDQALPSEAGNRDRRVGQGHGLFVKITSGGRVDSGAIDQIRDRPYIAGVQVSVTWAQLEPAKGEYDWKPIDAVLEQYHAVGKQVALVFMSASGKVPTPGQLNKGKGRSGPEEDFVNTATPAWLFDDPQVRRLGGMQTAGGKLPLYPVFWDEAYQRHLGEFLHALADRYDGDPRLEFIRMGGWQVGTNEPSFYGGATSYLSEQLAAEGEIIGGRRRPELGANSKYAQAVRELVDLWHRHFKKTRLAATIHFDRGENDGFETAMNEHCAKRGCLLLNTGLNERDHSGARTYFRRMHDERGLKVGWGGITHLGGGSRQSGRKPAPGSLLSALQQGVGDDNDPALQPASRVSYAVVGLDAVRNETALKWVATQLAD